MWYYFYGWHHTIIDYTFFLLFPHQNTASSIHVVDGHGHRSFDIKRQDLTVVQPTRQQLVDERLRAMATPDEASQANEGEEDTLLTTACHSKILLQNQSLDVTEEGRTIIRTISEGGGVTVKKDVRLHVHVLACVNFFDVL